MTFTKLFASITESTIWCEDDHTRLVWITMLAMCNKNGFVFASEPGLANRARVPLESVLRALGKFLGPDEYSRSHEHDGRRIEAVDGGWRLLNYRKHRAIRDEEDRRAYKSDWMRKYRHKDVDKSVDTCGQSRPPYPQAEAEAEAEADKSKIKVKSVRASFQKPSQEEVEQFAVFNGLQIDAAHFIDHFESNGWLVGGKAAMKNWKSAVRNWVRRGYTQPAVWRNGNVPTKTEQRLESLNRGRSAIITGLGIGNMSGQSEPAVQDRAVTGRSKNLAGVLRGRTSTDG